jgi:hypothetical protein
MFGLSKLWSAVATLTANVLELASTVASINTALRQRVGLEDGGAGEVPALTHQAAQDAAEAAEAANGSASRPRGRRKATDAA